jgi:hypothetical protein
LTSTVLEVKGDNLRRKWLLEPDGDGDDGDGGPAGGAA